MEFNIVTYNITEGDTYYSIAKNLILNNQEYREYADKNHFVKAVEAGLKLVLRNKKLVAGESIKIIDNVQYYINITFASSAGTKKGNDTINRITTFGETLYFNIKEYKEYNNYNWREDAENGEKLRGEMGQEVDGYNGDKLNSIKDKNGYIYVFDSESKLKYCFELKDGEYQEFEIANGLCNFNTPKGDKAEYATIKRFITDNPEDEHHDCKFVFSKVKLSAKRLKGDKANGIPKIDPNWFYRQVPILKYEYLGLQGELKSGVMLLHDYRNNVQMPTLSTYHLFSETFDNKEGVSIYYPDPLKELTRRAKIFQKRFEKKEKWENTKSRVQQLFLHTTISELIKNDSSLAGYADKERMDLWQKTYKEDLVQHTQKVHNAAQSLINWFKSHILHHTLLNYLSSDDKNDWCVALEVYNDALTYLKDCQLGRSFLSNQVRLKDSFVNKVLGYSSLEENTSASSIGQMVFRQAYLNQDKKTAIAFVIRKAQQSIFVLTNSFIPAYITYNEGRAKKMIKKFTLLSTGGKVKLNMTSVTPLQSIDKKVSIFDIEELGKFNEKLSAIDVKIKKGLNSKVVFTTVSLVEAFNVYYSLKVLLDDTDKENKMRKAAIFFGSLIDFTSNVASNRRAQGWILKAAANNKLITSGVKGVLKAVPVLNVISGAVDMFSGMDSAFEAYQDGEMGLAAGYSLNAVGGAICMVGGFMVLEAGQATVASGGTLAVAGGVTAAIGTGVYFIGSAVAYYYDNRDTKEWIEESIFGDEMKQLKREYPKYFNVSNSNVVKSLLGKTDLEESSAAKITSDQIESINNIMCDYDVDIRYRGIEYGGTEVYFIIKPGIITEAATISFNNVVAYAQARFFEYFQTESNRNERAVGTYKTHLPTIEMAKIKNNTQMVKRDKNGIVEQIIYKHYYDVDIDLVEGTVDLQLNSGTLQGVDPKTFSVKAPYNETY